MKGWRQKIQKINEANESDRNRKTVRDKVVGGNTKPVGKKTEEQKKAISDRKTKTEEENK